MDYREWFFQSAGRGMLCGPTTDPNDLEIRGAATEDSLNRSGQFQKDLVAIEVEVKEKQKFAETDGWAYLALGDTRGLASQVANTQDCYSCHSNNAATGHNLVQFYPTLIDLAKAHKTFRENARLGK